MDDGQDASTGVTIITAEIALSDAQGGGRPGSCPVCATALTGSIVHCVCCETEHHEECFVYTGHCARYACPGKTYAFEGAAPRSPDVVFVLEAPPDALSTAVDRLLDLVREGDVGRAVLAARTAAEQFPAASDGACSTWQEALAQVERLLGSSPNSEAPWLTRGILLDHLGRDVEAGACFAEACRRFRESARAKAHWGHWLIRHGRFEEAERAFMHGLRRTPG